MNFLITWIIIIISWAFIIYALFSSNNSNKCREQPEADFKQDPVHFIKPGRYNVTGKTEPTKVYPRGLITKGTLNVELMNETGRKMIYQYTAFNPPKHGNKSQSKVGEIAFRGRREIDYIVDNKHHRFYRNTQSFIDNKLVSTQHGFATKITKNILILDSQGSWFRTGKHHDDVFIEIKNSKDGFTFKVYNDHPDNPFEKLDVKLITDSL